MGFFFAAISWLVFLQFFLSSLNSVQNCFHCLVGCDLFFTLHPLSCWGDVASVTSLLYRYFNFWCVPLLSFTSSYTADFCTMDSLHNVRGEKSQSSPAWPIQTSLFSGGFASLGKRYVNSSLKAIKTSIQGSISSPYPLILHFLSTFHTYFM